MFVNEGRVADIFGPVSYTLETRTMPVMTALENWDRLFQAPFNSDVVFLSTRDETDQRWGTAQPITVRDKELGRCAFGPTGCIRIASTTWQRSALG